MKLTTIIQLIQLDIRVMWIKASAIAEFTWYRWRQTSEIDGKPIPLLRSLLMYYRPIWICKLVGKRAVDLAIEEYAIPQRKWLAENPNGYKKEKDCTSKANTV